MKPHKAFFIVIFFISGVLVGHYLPIWDSILPEFEGNAPSLSEALKDVLNKTGESLKELSSKNGEDFKKVKEKPTAIEPKAFIEPAVDKSPTRFFDTVVKISEIITAQEMKVQNSKNEEIYIILEGVEHKFEEFVPTLKKHIQGERLWLKPAMQHSPQTKSLLVYAYIIPRSWNKTMGIPIQNEKLLLNRIINKQFIKNRKK
ncbi:MAG: hypothetical protein K8S87_01500 [Planctomycetes bacterium]|nr:hypothetical protein [Planctomycetota bacterium]